MMVISKIKASALWNAFKNVFHMMVKIKLEYIKYYINSKWPTNSKSIISHHLNPFLYYLDLRDDS